MSMVKTLLPSFIAWLCNDKLASLSDEGVVSLPMCWYSVISLGNQEENIYPRHLLLYVTMAGKGSYPFLKLLQNELT